jgi:hypothetical protein
LENIGLDNYYLNRILIAQEIRARIDNLKFLHIKRKLTESRENREWERNLCQLLNRQGINIHNIQRVPSQTISPRKMNTEAFKAQNSSH